MKIKLESGECSKHWGPIILKLITDPKGGYIWVGAESNGPCFGYIENKKQMIAFAKRILKVVKVKP